MGPTSSSGSRSLPTETAAVLRHAVHRLRARDPEYDALRRALRAAIVVPVAAAVSFAVAGSGSQTTLFTIFGSVALVIIVDFPGNRPARALAYGGLGFNGAVLITVGTLVAPHPWLSVALMFVLGVAVTFAGVLSEIVAAGQRATLLMFVLPACTPVGPLPERLLGWLIALVVCVPAALFLFPPRHHDELRAHAARVCNRLADRLEGTASGREVAKAMNALYETFLGADYRPVGLTAGSRALVRVVDDLGWLSDRIADDTGELLGSMMKDPAVRVLRDCAAVLRLRSVSERAARRADLRDALTELWSASQGRYRDDIAELLGEADDTAAVAVGRGLLNRRTIASTIAVTGRIIRNAAAADARPVWARVLGRRLPDTGAADWVMPETVAVAAITKGFLATRAVVLRNSVRTGLGLALAVAVTHVFPVEHGFWVVLGAMSVLRSSALTTGTRVLRAVAGTAVGFVLGAVVIELLGVDPVVLWALLPIVAFGSAYMQVASFVAGQAAFTMMVLINFNLIVPTGWQLGLIRVEDVVVGALVGIVVSVLLWPRGATAAVSKAIDDARTAGAEFLKAAVLRVTRGASEDAANRVIALSRDALEASRTVDDAVRQYLSENGGSTDLRAPVVRAANRAIRLRAAAELIADVVPPPLDVYQCAREVLEAHADAICARLTGDPGRELESIGDNFVLALRADATRDVGALPSQASGPPARREGGLAISAALPLTTVAANLGELELLYPHPADPVLTGKE